MRTRGGGGDRFVVCDFCDADESRHGISWIAPVGNKGICNKCAADLEAAINRP
jgi:hypothetical protein